MSYINEKTDKIIDEIETYINEKVNCGRENRKYYYNKFYNSLVKLNNPDIDQNDEDIKSLENSINHNLASVSGITVADVEVFTNVVNFLYEKSNTITKAKTIR